MKSPGTNGQEHSFWWTSAVVHPGVPPFLTTTGQSISWRVYDQHCLVDPAGCCWPWPSLPSQSALRAHLAYPYHWKGLYVDARVLGPNTHNKMRSEARAFGGRGSPSPKGAPFAAMRSDHGVSVRASGALTLQRWGFPQQRSSRTGCSCLRRGHALATVVLKLHSSLPSHFKNRAGF